LTTNADHQPYDSTLKGFFEAEAAEIIPYLVPDARLQGTPQQAECNVELNLTTLLRTDKVYRAFYQDIRIIFHTELQIKPDAAFCRRLLAYNGVLHNEFEVPVLSLVILPFEHGSPDLFYEEKCVHEVFASVHPKVICLRNLDSEKIVREHRLSLYALLPTTKRPEVHLLKQALQEMHEQYDHERFNNRITWFKCLMDRTKTMTDEEKHTIQEVLQMQYQIDPIIRENPTIMAIVAEGEAEGEAKGLREAILDLASVRFPTLVISKVQQTIAPSQDIEQLKKLHHQIALVSDEQEVSALLTQCFPQQDQIDPLISDDPTIRAVAVQSEAKGLREAILDLISARFSSQVVAHVQQTITLRQDIEQLKRFFRQLLQVSDEEGVYASLAQCFSTD